MYKVNDKNNDLNMNMNSIQQNNTMYSLFESNNNSNSSSNSAPWDWFSGNNRHLLKKCTFCLNNLVQYSPMCAKHHFCQSCLNSQNLNLFVTQGSCPVCVQTMNENINLRSMNATSVHSLNSMIPSGYPCIKLTNIPWDVSQNDIRHFFGNCRFPSPANCIQSIHIMMDRTTGKTLSDAYIEFASISDMRRAIDTRNQKPLKGRIVSVSECTQEELLTIIFPKWRGQFQGISAIPPTTDIVRKMSTAAGGGNPSTCPPFITREEINSLLVVCKNYKLHFSRKCAERPFENIISVIAKYPWHQTHLISTMHRDHIYEMLKLSIESIKTHLAKDYVQIDSTLLERLTRAGIMCPAFTERQKLTLLQTARIECPQDILSFLVPTITSIYPLKQKVNKKPFKSSSWEDNDASFDDLLKDIQQQCHIQDSPALNTNTNFGMPLLLQPLEKSQQNDQQKPKPLSPWAPSFESKLPSDIWRMNTNVESNHVSSKSLLTA